MADTFQQLVDPTSTELFELIPQAIEKANYRCRVGKLSLDHPALRSLISDVLTEPEGCRRFFGPKATVDEIARGELTTVLGIAWWSDRLGVRHVLVHCFRLQRWSQHYHQRFGRLEELFPPLQMLFGHRVTTCVNRDGRAHTLVMCRCGNIGTPEQLAWMGPRCGPCHDYVTENGEEPEDVMGSLGWAFPTPAEGVAFSASGNTVISASAVLLDSSGTRALAFHDRAGKLIQKYEYDSFYAMRPLGFCCNGRIALIAQFDSVPVYDAETGLVILPDLGVGLTHAMFAPRSDRALIINGIGVHELSFIGRITTRQIIPFEYQNRFSLITALSPNGDYAALAQERVVQIVRVADGRTNVWPMYLRDGEIRSIVFLDDDRLVVGSAHRGDPNEFGELPQGEVVIVDSEGRFVEELPLQRGNTTSLAIEPTRSIIASGGSRGSIHLWDGQAHEPIGSIEWHRSEVSMLAFSPDGEWLASASLDGHVRLWPWRQLFGACR